MAQDAKRHTYTIRVNLTAEEARDLRVAAALAGKTQAIYLTDLLREHLTRVKALMRKQFGEL